MIRNPKAAHSSEAVHVALFFANLAWNECVGLGAEGADQEHLAVHRSREPETLGRIEVEDIDGMVDELVEYKKAHFPDDQRRILACGGTDHSTIRVEWLPPCPWGGRAMGNQPLRAGASRG